SLEELFSSKLRVKIIRLLAKFKELNISSIVKETNSNHSDIVKNLNYLKNIGLIEERFFGRIHIIRFRNEILLGKILDEFCRIFETNPCD
nr:ArsR family transcriptional regulator [Candidatus Sigynarchaeota archaeon]